MSFGSDGPRQHGHGLACGRSGGPRPRHWDLRKNFHVGGLQFGVLVHLATIGSFAAVRRVLPGEVRGPLRDPAPFRRGRTEWPGLGEIARNKAAQVRPLSLLRGCIGSSFSTIKQ
jgi:hypothetical protein